MLRMGVKWRCEQDVVKSVRRLPVGYKEWGLQKV